MYNLFHHNSVHLFHLLAYVFLYLFSYFFYSFQYHFFSPVMYFSMLLLSFLTLILLHAGPPAGAMCLPCDHCNLFSVLYFPLLPPNSLVFRILILLSLSILSIYSLSSSDFFVLHHFFPAHSPFPFLTVKLNYMLNYFTCSHGNIIQPEVLKAI